MKKSMVAVCVMAGLASAAPAKELKIGVGADDVLNQTGTQSTTFNLEVHGDPFSQRGAFSWRFGAALHADTDGDIWVGVGIVTIYDMNDRWFFESSLMPGYYRQGTGGTPLNHPLEFRTLLGVGYRITPDSNIELTFDHKSNASIASPNPGSETLMLRMGRSF